MCPRSRKEREGEERRGEERRGEGENRRLRIKEVRYL